MSILGYQMPLIRCKSEGKQIRPGCGPIFLPYPNPPEVSLDRPKWPTDAWKPFVICKSCGLGYEHTARDVEWRSSHSPVLPQEMFVLYIELKCGQKDCEFPVKLYLNSDSAMTKPSRDAKLESGSKNAKCEAGHAPAEPLTVVRCTIAEEIF